MRLLSLAVIGLMMASAPAHAGAPSAKLACATSLEKAERSSGFAVVRKCESAVPRKAVSATGMTRQPVGAASNFAQPGASDSSDGAGVSDGGVFVVALLGLTAFVFGVIETFDNDDRDLPTSP